MEHRDVHFASSVPDLSPPPKCIKSSAIAKQILRPLASVSEQSLLTEIKLRNSQPLCITQ
ncbi:hypothetical protein SPX_11630 [Sporomusa paucivorans]